MPYDGITPEVAWAAGLFEGEGCAWTSTFARRGTTQRTFGLAVVSTDRDVLERFAAIVGGPGAIYGPKDRPHPDRRPVYQWVTQRRGEVRRVLTLFRPLLCSRRAAKADEILDMLGR